MTLLKFKNGEDKNIARAFSPLLTDVFDEFLGGSLMNAGIARVPAVNISETAEDFKVELAVPGLQKDDFKINLEKDLLSISAEKKSETKEDGTKFTRKEYNYSVFKRSFNLPDTADRDTIKAEYSNGILTLTIYKKKEAVNVNKEIKIS
jgi:HSP20 family protein